MGAAKKRRHRSAPVPQAESLLRDALGRGMSPGQCSRLRLALRLERGSAADKDEAAEICRAIEAELRAGISETISLEKARGGTVQEINRGPIRCNDRDGLHALLSVKGGLTAAQYDAGLEFRAGWELRTCDLRSGMDQTGGGAHDNDRFVMARLQRSKKLTRTAIIEQSVALNCMTEPAALHMLRRVAGDGFPLSTQGKGRAFERNLTALKMALDVADAVIRGK